MKDWEAMNNMMKLQFTEIQASFEKSLTVLEHIYKGNVLYLKLVF